MTEQFEDLLKLYLQKSSNYSASKCYWNFISFWLKKIPSEKNDFSNRIRKMVFNKKPVTDEMAAIPKPAI